MNLHPNQFFVLFVICFFLTPLYFSPPQKKHVRFTVIITESETDQGPAQTSAVLEYVEQAIQMVMEGK